MSLGGIKILLVDSPSSDLLKYQFSFKLDKFCSEYEEEEDFYHNHTYLNWWFHWDKSFKEKLEFAIYIGFENFIFWDSCASAHNLDMQCILSAFGGVNSKIMKFVSANKHADSNYFKLACAHGGLDTIKLLYSGEGILKNISAAIGLAAQYGNLDIVKYLISEGCTDMYLGLIGAARSGNLDILKFILNQDNFKNYYNLAKNAALQNNHNHIAEFLDNYNFTTCTNKCLEFLE